MSGLGRSIGLACFAALLAAPVTVAGLTPFIDLQEQGLTVVADGAGLRATGSASLTVSIGGPIRFGLLYWAGRDTACPVDGAGNCVVTQPYLDQQIVFNGTPITGTVLDAPGEEQPSSNINNIVYFADVTSLVSAAGPGTHSFSFTDGNASSNLDIREGVTLFVAYTNASDPKVYRVLVQDGVDFAWANDPDTGDPRVTTTVTFNHGATASTRIGQLFIAAGDGDAAKDDRIDISNNSSMVNALNGSDGSQWDTEVQSVAIPGGVASTTVQLVSPATASADEFIWVMAALRVPPEADPPVCTLTVSSTSPKQLTFDIQDTGSGVESIVVHVSENADTVVPPYVPGTTSSIGVTSTKINQSQAMRIEMAVSDVAGNVQTCGYRDSPFPIANFDGDTRSDLAVFRPSTTRWWILRSMFGPFVPLWGLAGDRLVPGDYDRDAKTDVAVWRPSDGNWWILRSSGGFTTQRFGATADVPVPGDYDGDGKTDLAVFRPSDGTWRILLSLGGQRATPFGTSTDVPVPGDYDGDSKTDLAVFRPADGSWWVLRSTGSVTLNYWGNSTDIPVQGDYEGDGKTDIAVWRPSTQTFWVLQSSGGVNVTTFGQSGDRPVVGDYDGDRRIDLTVWRPSTGQWWSLLSGGGVNVTTWGQTGDVPVGALSTQ